PVAGYPRVLRVATVVSLREAIARNEHTVACREARIGGSLNDAGEVDAADQREPAQHLARPRGGKRILVVDGREQHAHDYVAGGEIRELQLLEARDHAFALAADTECLECCGHGEALMVRAGVCISRHLYAADRPTRGGPGY